MRSENIKVGLVLSGIAAAVIGIVLFVNQTYFSSDTTEYSLVYQLCDEECSNSFVYNATSRQVFELSDETRQDFDSAKLYFHDPRADETRQVTLEESNQLTLSRNNISPDGFQFQARKLLTEDKSALDQEDYAHLVNEDGEKIELNIIRPTSTTGGTLDIIGWVLPEEGQ